MCIDTSGTSAPESRRPVVTSLPSITGEGSALPAQSASSETAGYIQPTLAHGLRIWWAFYWRTSLVSLVAAFLLGLGARQLLSLGALTPATYNWTLKMGPYVMALASAVFVLHYAICKRYRTFRIGLMSTQQDTFGRELKPTRGRTLRVWWTFTWRAIAYTFFLSLAANILLTVLLGIAEAISPGLGRPLTMLTSTVVTGAASMFVIYSNVLDEDIGDFRVTLLPLEGNLPSAPTAERASVEGAAATDPGVTSTS